MRAIVYGVGLAAAMGVLAVTARSLDSVRPYLTRAEVAAKACAPGPDYSAAFCNAAQADMDEPISTARYIPPPMAPGLMAQAMVSPAAAAPSPAPIQLVSAAPPPSASHEALTTPPRVSRALDLPVQVADASGPATPIIAPAALAESREWSGPTAARFAMMTPAAPRQALADRLRQRVGVMKDPGQKPRLFMFVGDGPDMLAYNLTREEGQIVNAGWTMERTVRLGGQQMGLAWQRGQMRLAVTGFERRASQLGLAVKDKVVAISLCFSPGANNQRSANSSRRD